VDAAHYKTDAEQRGQGAGKMFMLGDNETRPRFQGLSWRTPLVASATKPVDPALPVVQVSWEDAEAFCRFATTKLGDPAWLVDLPTEAEWERAAAWDGQVMRIYAFGSKADPKLASYGNGTTFEKLQELGSLPLLPVSSFPDGRSPTGAHNMTGNVYEWCADIYKEGWYLGLKQQGVTQDPYCSTNDSALSGADRCMRGGSFASAWDEIEVYNRDYHMPANDCTADLGFRVVVARVKVRRKQ
jgi:formylglycine-generating enzyme required for sulfatase activity